MIGSLSGLPAPDHKAYGILWSLSRQHRGTRPRRSLFSPATALPFQRESWLAHSLSFPERSFLSYINDDANSMATGVSKGGEELMWANHADSDRADGSIHGLAAARIP